jgi:serine beta-lactamase-like protein LACTB
MAKNRIPTWVSLILLGVALLAVGIPGLFVYMGVTARKLHPDRANIPSVVNSPPLAKWAAAAEQAGQIVRTSLTESNLPGISVAVGIDGGIVWAEGFGFANIDNNLPVTPDHRFRIGTASMLLTSAGIGLLLDQGRLKLDDEIQAYVPEFPKKQWPVTIRQVMAEAGGIKTEDPDDGVLTSSHCERPADAVKLFATEPLLYQPGTETRYSTFGWVLLSAAIETASGTPLTAFLDDEVFRPIGMLDTVKDSVMEPVPQEASAYLPRLAGNPIYGLNPLFRFDYSCHSGSSGFLSTPSDLVRFGMAINGGKLLRPATVQTFQTPQRLASGMETGYGLGWEVKTVTLTGRQVRAAGHNGRFWTGTVASLLTFPELGMAVAVTSNTEFEDAPSVAERIAQAFAEQGILGSKF